MASLQDAFYRSQQTKYQDIESNRILPDAIKGSLGSTILNGAMDSMSSYDPYTNKTVKPFSPEAAKGILQGTPKDVAELARCRQYSGLAGLEQLIRDTQDSPNLPIRCGWRYKKSPGSIGAEVSQGALGTPKGPLDTTNPLDLLGNGVEWIWNLNDAKKRILTDTAREGKTGEFLKIAESISNGDFKGRFGYCTTTKKMIPVLPNGRPMYPNDPLNTCPPGSLIIDYNKVPPPSMNNALANFQQVAFRELANCADTGKNPSLTRDCLLQAVKNNGCSIDGTLYTSLQGVDPNQPRWDSQLKSQQSFQAYQSKQGDNGFTDKLFQRGMSDWNQAIREVARLQSAAQSASDPYVRISAKDLCNARGTFDTYNFCAEIADGAPIQSVELSCLQYYWQELNGKPAGALYPTTVKLKAALGTINTYGDYKAAVKRLQGMLASSDPVVQRVAARNFLGVNVNSTPFTPKTLYSDGIMQTPIVFWIDAMDGSSLTLDGKNGIKQWKDKSGQKRDLIQNESYLRPTYTKSGAYAGIEFAGTNQFMLIPNPNDMIRNQFTVFVVEKRKSDKNSNFFLGGTSFATNQDLVLGYRFNTTGTMAFLNNDVNFPLPSFKGASEMPRIWSFVKPSGPKQVFVDGVQVVSGFNNPDPLLGWPGAAIGRYATRFYQGIVYEIIIYNAALDRDTRQKVEGYLAQKWAVPSLPASHPYVASPP
jgi:hypothetical protein